AADDVARQTFFGRIVEGRPVGFVTEQPATVSADPKPVAAVFNHAINDPFGPRVSSIIRDPLAPIKPSEASVARHPTTALTTGRHRFNGKVFFTRSVPRGDELSVAPQRQFLVRVDPQLAKRIRRQPAAGGSP